VHEAGGRLTDLEGAAPRYNGETPRHAVLAASGSELQPALLDLVRRAEREVARGRPR
jgi:myo-inositol-1(or 4)-monophosphatase